jgi:hypothetical protein
VVKGLRAAEERREERRGDGECQNCNMDVELHRISKIVTK